MKIQLKLGIRGAGRNNSKINTFSLFLLAESNYRQAIKGSIYDFMIETIRFSRRCPNLSVAEMAFSVEAIT